MSQSQQESDDSGIEPVNANHDINNLCTRCSSAFLEALSSYETLKEMLHRCDGSKLLVHNRLQKKSFPHHTSFYELKEAARAGCHLCSLIELYCTAYTMDSDLPVVLCLDLRDKRERGYTFNVCAGKDSTEIHLGLKGTYLIHNCSVSSNC